MSDEVAAETIEEPPREYRKEYALALRRCTPKQRAWARKVAELAGQKWAACDRLGLSKHTVWKWLRQDRMQKVLELQALMAEQDHDITRERILREYERIAFANLNDFRSVQGIRLQFTAWTDDMSAAVQECEFDESGQPAKIKLHRKSPALDTLARIQGVLIDRSELTLKDATPPVVHIVERDDSD